MYRGIIYKYTSPSNKVYIGQTSREKQRRWTFLNLKYRYGGTKIDNARKKYLPEKFRYEVLETLECNSQEQLNKLLDARETYYIALFDSFRNGYNSSAGGNSNTRYIKHSEEWCEENSKRMKKLWKEGILQPNLKGAFLGKHHTQETKKQISDSKCKSVSRYTKEGIYIDSALTSFYKNLGYNVSAIIQCCKGKRRAHQGYIWKYNDN